MGTVIAALLFALPSLLVLGAYFALRQNRGRATRIMWMVVAACWVAAVWFWIDYNRQFDDVGLMVRGIMAQAASTASLLATVVAFVLTRRL